MFGVRKKLRGKYNPTVKRRKYPNLQWLAVPVDVKHKNYIAFAGKRILACAKCIKTLSKPDRKRRSAKPTIEQPKAVVAERQKASPTKASPKTKH